MPFTTTKEHRDFFHNHHRIEFEDLLTEEQCLQIQKGARAHGRGRDLWRRDPAVKKIINSKDFAQLAGELTGARAIRLGYDQMVGPQLTAMASLHDMTCIQGIVCGVLVCIQKPSDDEEEFSEFFPQHVGTALFFSADCPIPFEDLAAAHKDSYFLLVYAAKDAVYIHQDGDPFLHEWKKLGYTFGDRLKDLHHPMLYP